MNRGDLERKLGVSTLFSTVELDVDVAPGSGRRWRLLARSRYTLLARQGVSDRDSGQHGDARADDDVPRRRDCSDSRPRRGVAAGGRDRNSMSDAAHYRSLFAHCGAAASVRSLRAAGTGWAVAAAPVLGGSARLDHRPGPGRDFDRCAVVARPRLDRNSRNRGARARDRRGHAHPRALVSPGSEIVDRHRAPCGRSDGPRLARQRHARAAWSLARELSADRGRRSLSCR